MEALLLALVIGLTVASGWHALEPAFFWTLTRAKNLLGKMKQRVFYSLTFFR